MCTYISVDLVNHEIFHAQVGKGGINVHILTLITLHLHGIIACMALMCL